MSSTSSSSSNANHHQPIQLAAAVSNSNAAAKYKPEWGSLLLGLRLLRSNEFNERLRSLKSHTSIALILEHISYLIRARALLSTSGDEAAGFDTLVYLLSVYLPVLTVSSNGMFIIL